MMSPQNERDPHQLTTLANGSATVTVKCSDEEFEELEGSRGRCPKCHRSIWVESGCAAECHHCGWTNAKDDEDEPDTERDTLASLGLSEGDFR